MVADGNFTLYPANPSSPSSLFIINITSGFRMTSPTTLINDVSTPVGASPSSYGPQHPSTPAPQHPIPSYSGVKFVTFPLILSVSPASVTGIRDNSTSCNDMDIFNMNMFRLSQTSSPLESSTHMLAFSHNEDHYHDTDPYQPPASNPSVCATLLSSAALGLALSLSSPLALM